MRMNGPGALSTAYVPYRGLSSLKDRLLLETVPLPIRSFIKEARLHSRLTVIRREILVIIAVSVAPVPLPVHPEVFPFLPVYKRRG